MREDHRFPDTMYQPGKIFNSDVCYKAASEILCGRRPAEIPWHDRTFQDALIKGINRLRALEQDAKDLAVIKKVFGGAK